MSMTTKQHEQDRLEQMAAMPFMMDAVSTRLAPTARRLSSDRMWRRMRDLPVVNSWKVVRDSLFLLTSFAFGLAWFIFFVTVATVGLGTIVVWVGIPILAALIAITIWCAQMERDRIRVFLNVSIPSPYRYFPSEGAVWKRAWGLLRNPQLWRDLVYLLLLLPVGILGFAVVWLPLGYIISPAVFVLAGDYETNGWLITSFGEALLACITGLILVLPFSVLINLVAILNGKMGVRFLAPSTEEVLIERVEELTESRSAVMRAMHLERRRIERDLHDGAQQRLVALAMDLGMAREKILTDPEGAQRLLDTTHEESKRVLADLRDLVRGIHPAVLTDRGLDAAISAIAGRSPVPVDVNVNLPGRLPEEVEGTAYFVVVEALTNIAKHSGATWAGVQIHRRGGWLVVEIADNGVGGANLDGSSGLRGLQDRILALDGRFTISSPKEKGTTIRVEIPCG